MNNDYDVWCNDRCDEIESLGKSFQTRAMHRKINELTNGIKLRESSATINSKDGRTLTTNAEVKDRWVEYCSDLYNYQSKVDPSILDHLWSGQSQESLPDLLLSEITEAISKLKNGKATGVDGVCAELIKTGGEPVIDALHDICNRAWNEEKFPSIWCKSVIVTIPKKGDLRQCENYRTISLISHSSKVLLEVIRRRLKPYIEGNLSQSQAGYRLGRGTYH